MTSTAVLAPTARAYRWSGPAAVCQFDPDDRSAPPARGQVCHLTPAGAVLRADQRATPGAVLAGELRGRDGAEVAVLFRVEDVAPVGGEYRLDVRFLRSLAPEEYRPLVALPARPV